MLYIGLFLLLTIIFYIIYVIFAGNISSFSVKPKIPISFKLIDYNLSENKVNTYFITYIIIAISLIFLSVYFLTNFILIVALIVIILSLPYLIIRYIKNKRISLFEKQLPDAIDLMAGSLLAGNSLSGAFSMIGEEYPPPLSKEISMVVREQKLGVSVDQSLQNFAKRMPLNSVVLLVSVIRTSVETGGELSDALKNVARTLRSIEQAEGKIRALTSQGKMQAWVVGMMPVLLIVVLSKMEPEAMSQLWTTKEGYIALLALIIFEVLGIIFIRKIVNIDI